MLTSICIAILLLLLIIIKICETYTFKVTPAPVQTVIRTISQDLRQACGKRFGDFPSSVGNPPLYIVFGAGRQ